MDITTAALRETKNRLKEAKGKPHIELEAKYNDRMSDSQFKNLIRYFRKNGRGYTESRSVTMDLSTEARDDFRVTLNNQEQIYEYCKSKVLPEETSSIIKSRSGLPEPVFLNKLCENEAYKFKINIKKEEPTVEDQDFNNYFQDKIIHCRFKKRFTFQKVNESKFRIDLTLVRSFKCRFGEFSEQDINRSEEKPEVEIEVLPIGDKDDIDVLSKEFLRTMYTVLCVIKKTSNVISTEEKNYVLKSYADLLGIHYGGSFPTDEYLRKNNAYISYKPVTIQLQNLQKDQEGILGNVLQNYAVTEKADGDRLLMFLSETGKVYFINDRFEVTYSGIQGDNLPNKTLLDGEYISKDMFGNPDKKYMGFDIYFYAGVDTRPFAFENETDKSKSRYSKLKQAMKEIQAKNKTDVEFASKVFNFVTKKMNIFNIAEDLYKKRTNKFTYHIDGLIYQPTNLGCGQTYVNRPIKYDGGKYSMTWNRLLKWKPPHENTIDFLIIVDDMCTGGTLTNCKLCVYDNGNSSQKPSVCEILKGKNARFSTMVTDGGKPFVFAQQMMSMEELRTAKVKSFDIVEFMFVNYDSSIHNAEEFEWTDQHMQKRKGRWRIHRKRTDKTELLRKRKPTIRSIEDVSDALVGTANALTTADNVFSSIFHAPVLEEVIYGKTKKENHNMSSEYYVNLRSREQKIMFDMQKFHNLIKSDLIKKYGGEDKSLLDLACGKGGDIKKYNNAYKSVLGFDISYDNVYGSSDSAWSRYAKLPQPKTPMLFLVKDMGSDLKEVIDDGFTIHELKEIAKFVLLEDHVMDSAQCKSVTSELRPFKDLVRTKKFDVISCQFALHYFFKNEEYLDKFCENVDALLKPGGHFIGTCFNGQEIDDKFGENGVRIEGSIDENVVWRVDKRYRDFKTERIGAAIDVYIESIGQSIQEYLVHMDLLREKLSKFKITIQDKDKDLGSFKSKFYKDDYMMRKAPREIQELSSMYQYFVFYKEE